MSIIDHKISNYFILLLIIVNLAEVRLKSNFTPHDLSLSYFFNYCFLGNENLDMYEDQDNASQPFQKYILLTDLQDHFRNVFQMIYNYNNYVAYEYDESISIHLMNLEYKNGSIFKDSFSTSEIQEFIMQDLKEFFNSIIRFQITYQLGTDQKYQIIKLNMQYKNQKNWYLRTDIQPILQKYTNQNLTIQLKIIRAIIIALAALIIILKMQQILQKKTQKNSEDNLWIYVVIILNIFIMISSTWSILFSFLQFVPILEKLGNKYLFSFALRYALPIILAIQFTVCILLIGIIIYSIIQYPSSLFQDFKKSFFSYFYNNFQLATYEIFLQIDGQGIIAYLVYMLLYFYMVLVAHSLIPSLFCGLVRKKRREKNLKDFLERIETICPNCKSNPNQFQINEQLGINVSGYSIQVYSPNIIPLIQNQKIKVQKQKSSNPVRKFIIEQEIVDQQRNKSKLLLIQSKINYLNQLFSQFIMELQILESKKFSNFINSNIMEQLKKYSKIDLKVKNMKSKLLN